MLVAPMWPRRLHVCAMLDRRRLAQESGRRAGCGRPLHGPGPAGLLRRDPDVYACSASGVSRHRRGAMAEFMDVHRGMVGITPEGLLEAHQADLAIQGEENVDFKHAWADPNSGMVFCLSEAPSAEAVQRIHERAGHPADEIYEVPVQA